MDVEVTTHGTGWPPLLCVRFKDEPPTVEKMGEIVAHLRSSLLFINELVTTTNNGFLAFFSVNVVQAAGRSTSFMESEVQRVLTELSA